MLLGGVAVSKLQQLKLTNFRKSTSQFILIKEQYSELSDFNFNLLPCFALKLLKFYYQYPGNYKK